MRKQLWLGLVISAVCLYFAVRGISFRDVSLALRQADPKWLIASLGIYTCGYALRAVRWEGLLKPIKSVSARSVMGPLIIGFFANNVLPFRMGELIRAHVSGQKFGISRTASLGTIVVERIFDTLSLLSIFLTVAFFCPFPGTVKHAAYVLGGACAGSIIVLLLASKHQTKTHSLIARLPVSPAWREKLQDIVVNFAHGVSGMTKGGYVIQAMLLSLVIWMIEGTMVYFVTRAFPVGISYPQAFFLLFFLALSVTLPQAPGYVGTVELSGVISLHLLGVPREQGLPVILTLHGLQFSFIAFFGCLALWKEGLSLGGLFNQSNP